MTTAVADINKSPLTLNATKAAKMCGIGRTKWYAMVGTGQAPKPIKIGSTAHWRTDELIDWVDGGCEPWHIWKYKRPERYNTSE